MGVITLRPQNDSDYDFLWRLHRDTMRDYVAATRGWDEELQRALFDRILGQRSHEIIEVDGRPIGAWWVVREPARILLGSIEITPDHRGLGIGTQLIQRLLGEADTARVPVDLRVLCVNPARALYERLGFHEVETTETHVVMRRNTVKVE